MVIASCVEPARIGANGRWNSPLAPYGHRPAGISQKPLSERLFGGPAGCLRRHTTATTMKTARFALIAKRKRAIFGGPVGAATRSEPNDWAASY